MYFQMISPSHSSYYSIWPEGGGWGGGGGGGALSIFGTPYMCASTTLSVCIVIAYVYVCIYNFKSECDGVKYGYIYSNESLCLSVHLLL